MEVQSLMGSADGVANDRACLSRRGSLDRVAAVAVIILYELAVAKLV
jgi:hypothetical protein